MFVFHVKRGQGMIESLDGHTGRIIVYDSTLREGEQMPGVRFTPEQKLKIGSMLIEAGVHQIEAGFAAVSPDERRAIRSLASMGSASDILSLARARRSDIDDALSCDVDMIIIFIATSELHMRQKLRMNEQQVIEAICSSIDYAKGHGVKVAFSTEDTTRSAPAFLRRAYKAAADCGADRLGIADTVGCATPEKVVQYVNLVREISDLPVSVHLHNDFGLALANALIAVRAGATAVATTVCGFGERAGNVPLEQFAMSMKYLYGRDLGIKTELLTSIASKVAEFACVNISPIQPWVGANVFAHESGIHVAAVLRDSKTYEFLPPETVGNSRKIGIGKHSGRSMISMKLKEKSLTASDKNIEAIFYQVKSRGDQKGALSEEEFWNIVNSVLKSKPVRNDA